VAVGVHIPSAYNF